MSVDGLIDGDARETGGARLNGGASARGGFMRAIWHTVRHWLVLLYGVAMFVLVVLFFFNYGGRWMRLLAEMFPIKGP